jgi:hypothetical protein
MGHHVRDGEDRDRGRSGCTPEARAGPRGLGRRRRRRRCPACCPGRVAGRLRRDLRHRSHDRRVLHDDRCARRPAAPGESDRLAVPGDRRRGEPHCWPEPLRDRGPHGRFRSARGDVGGLARVLVGVARRPERTVPAPAPAVPRWPARLRRLGVAGSSRHRLLGPLRAHGDPPPAAHGGDVCDRDRQPHEHRLVRTPRWRMDLRLGDPRRGGGGRGRAVSPFAGGGAPTAAVVHVRGRRGDRDDGPARAHLLPGRSTGTGADVVPRGLLRGAAAGDRDRRPGCVRGRGAPLPALGAGRRDPQGGRRRGRDGSDQRGLHRDRRGPRRAPRAPGSIRRSASPPPPCSRSRSSR